MDRHTPFITMKEMKHWFMSEVERMERRLERHIDTTVQDTVASLQEQLVDLDLDYVDLHQRLSATRGYLQNVQVLEKRIDNSGQALQKSWNFSLGLRERITQAEDNHQRMMDASQAAPPPSMKHRIAEREYCLMNESVAGRQPKSKNVSSPVQKDYVLCKHFVNICKHQVNNM